MFYNRIEGKKVYLSPLVVSEENIRKCTKWMNDTDVSQWVGKASSATTEAEERNFLEKTKDENNKTFMIIDKKTDQFIGTAGINRIHSINRSATLGIFIGEKVMQNAGRGTEVISLLLKMCFEELNLHSVKLSVYSDNKRAIRCYEKCGFKKAGELRDALFLHGKYQDCIIMDILKDDYYENVLRDY